ncbi:hypothetical protein F5887DRAFT_885949 [Amanita rubescens]|nr:hypothetical protein F5887DRAFT_885949 [Amanita rubescens]
MQHDPGPSTGKRKRTEENTADERNSKRPTLAQNESDDDEIVPIEFGSSLSIPLSPSPFPDFLPSTTVSASSSFSTYHPHRTPTPTPTPTITPPPPPPPETLSEYTCPICFSPPTNATITPCGHICCGACLFTAVKTTLHRGAMTYSRDPNVARCPVCRAHIPGWDGRGGGVIGLKPRVVITL